ncbi:hypothetical protein [Agrococcus sp. SGAir0287]|uniref:hypothetical protein n=1 Tax=Agrococcus sp. SGAir0287 TaxID=2070347 RepID=UPI0010CCF1F6|nr:hypothetical protein [Agrococcus sp. SGAir0287]QCR18473.1 hypothetical protein C1N71_02580 [Agrococcus sp. SGAir0287]
MEWIAWIVLAAGIVVLVAIAPRLHRRERERQRVRGTIPGGFGVVDEVWRPTEHAARLEREQREEVGDEAPAPGEPDWLQGVDLPPELAEADEEDRSHGDEQPRDRD